MADVKQKYLAKDFIILFGGFLGATKLGLASVGIHVPDDLIEAIVNGVAFGWGMYAVWANTYTSPKARKQKAVLDAHRDEWDD